EQIFDRALSLTRSTGDWLMEGFLYINAGNMELARGRLDQAQDNYRNCFKVRSEHGDRRGVAAAVGSLGQISEQNGDLEMAAEYYREGLRELARGQVLWDLAGAMAGLAVEPWLRGDFARAAIALGAAEGLKNQLKTRRDV